MACYRVVTTLIACRARNFVVAGQQRAHERHHARRDVTVAKSLSHLPLRKTALRTSGICGWDGGNNQYNQFHAHFRGNLATLRASRNGVCVKWGSRSGSLPKRRGGRERSNWFNRTTNASSSLQFRPRQQTFVRRRKPKDCKVVRSPLDWK